jgi:hypothetical protein
MIMLHFAGDASSIRVNASVRYPQAGACDMTHG